MACYGYKQFDDDVRAWKKYALDLLQYVIRIEVEGPQTEVPPMQPSAVLPVFLSKAQIKARQKARLQQEEREKKEREEEEEERKKQLEKDTYEKIKVDIDEDTTSDDNDDDD